MTFHRIGVLSLATVASLLMAAPASAEDVAVIVGFHGQADAGIFARHGGRPGTDLGALGAYAGHVPAARLRALRREAGVAYVEEDLVRQPSIEPNDTYYAAVPGYPATDAQRDDFALINAPAAWDVTTGGGVRVAVLDTGCELKHTDIGSGSSGKVKAWRNFTGGKTTDVLDKNGHGTHTAGTVGAKTNSRSGVAGAGWSCDLLIAKVLGQSGGYDSWIAAGIDWSVTNGARVVSMSLGGGGTTTTLESAINRAFSAGTLSIAAAGNDPAVSVEYPAGYANCMSIAACDSTGALASFSNRGPSVDLMAPGVRVLSTYTRGSYAWLSGTSMATPHVSGIAALVYASGAATTPAGVWTRLTATATPGYAFPLLNAGAAVSAPLQ